VIRSNLKGDGGKSFWPIAFRNSSFAFYIWILVAGVAGVVLAQLPLLWAMVWVGGSAVFLLNFNKPLVGLGVTLLLGPLGALESLLTGGSSLDSSQVMLLLTVAAWIARRLSRRHFALPYTRLNVPLFLFLAVTFLTLLAAPSLEFGLREWVKWLEILLVMWLVVDMAGEQRSEGESSVECQVSGATPAVWVLVMLLLAGLSQAAVGIWQFGLRDTGPEHFEILGRFYRAYGTFEQPNPFGGFMNLSVLLALGVVVSVIWRGSRGAGEQGRETWRPSFFLLMFVGTCLLATTAALLMSWSRGAWLGFAGGTAVFVLFWTRRRWQGFGLLLLAALLLWGGLTFNLLPAAVAERITNFREDVTFGDARGVDINDANYAVIERLAHWQAALDMARDHFWLGVGFGNYEPAYHEYALINWPFPLGHAHNYYLNLLAETGVLGLVAYVGLWTAVFWQAIRLLYQLNNLPRGIVLGLLAAFAALAVHQLVDKLYVNNIYIHLGAMFGLLQLLDTQPEQSELQSVTQAC
jgi:O-antigen ligase